METANGTDRLVDSLVTGLRPVTPLRPGRPLWIACAWTVAFAIFVVMAYGPRAEWTGFEVSTVASQTGVLGKPLLFLSFGFLALFQTILLARPTGHISKPILISLAIMAVGLFAILGRELAEDGPRQVLKGLWGANLLCVSTITLGGLAGLAALGALWLRRSASPYPGGLAAFAGAATASMSAGAYAIHCNMDAPIYLIGMYCTSITAVGAIGYFVGYRRLRW